MKRTRIKICGITTVEQAKAAVDAGADAIGLVFAEDSPRLIDIEVASEIVLSLPPFVTPVGVFQLTKGVNQNLEQWKHLGQWCQLHGDENEQAVKQVARSLSVCKGFRFHSGNLKKWDQSKHVQFLLIEGGSAGSGKPWNYSKLAKLMSEISTPVALAGGLDATNVKDAIVAARPFAVDVSSGVESKPGVKDPEMIHTFCTAVREADMELVEIGSHT